MATTIITSSYLSRARRAVQSALGQILRVTAFFVIAVVGGLLSSWYIVDYGAAFNTERIGPWLQWTHAGRTDADPYSVVHNNRHERLVFSSTFVSRYEAHFDSENRRLHSSCHYAIQGPAPSSEWWTLDVFESDGRLIPNPANRHGYNASTIVPNTDGSIRIDLAREARPGNWIPTSRAGRLVVVLEVQNLTGDANVLDSGQAMPRLPAIQRVSCR